MKKQIMLIFIILLFTLLLSGCTKNIDERFIGTWKEETEGFSTLTFFSDSTGSISGLSMDGK